MADRIKKVALIAVAWMFVVGLIILYGFPLPNSGRAWLALIAFGPPLYLLGEGFFSWLFSREHGRRISQNTFSGRRILIALIASLIIFGGVWLIESLLELRQ